MPPTPPPAEAEAREAETETDRALAKAERDGTCPAAADDEAIEFLRVEEEGREDEEAATPAPRSLPRSASDDIASDGIDFEWSRGDMLVDLAPTRGVDTGVLGNNSEPAAASRHVRLLASRVG
uniref:Uncharacterized protein n=1 Tax=Odontella aurita TaxID=265563 RepID=A0A7S4MA70_9STRA|mmetsp:Transcript_15385/g.44633  ORF Transcript_15385/g.44633 Transcript_15385/m.44633 type:complete len:123 (+) Transcript_15385:56-424(+)